MKIGNIIFKPIDFFVFLSLILGTMLFAAIVGSVNLNVSADIVAYGVMAIIFGYIFLVVKKRNK